MEWPQGLILPYSIMGAYHILKILPGQSIPHIRRTLLGGGSIVMILMIFLDILNMY